MPVDDRIQKMVDVANKDLNEKNERAALVRIKEIASLKKSREEYLERVDKQIAELQDELFALKFDSVTAEDIVGANAQ